MLSVALLVAGVLALSGHSAQGEVIVHLFEWRFDDIADECVNFLSKYGYSAVQVSPVNENAIIGSRPWYERYQPVSYRLMTRSGNEQQFRDMVRTCNKAGVKIYVDIVVNHMTASLGQISGTGGSRPDTNNKKYPDVPYGPGDFHQSCSINNWNDPWQVRNCELVGLHDLNQKSPYVRGKIIEFLNKLVDIGVAGFRVDAAKHMDVSDLSYIYSQVKNLNTEFFPANTRPYIYQEIQGTNGDVIKPSDYFGIGSAMDFKYGFEVSKAFNRQNQLKWFQTFGEHWGLLPWQKSVVFIDNHDSQRDGIFGLMPLTYKQSRPYKMAVGFMLAWPHSVARVMSSFSFNSKEDGPPSDGNKNIARVVKNNDLSCGGGWVCEHRWSPIFGMVGFAKVVQGTQVSNWWDNGNYQIAFCRGNRGFVAINNDNEDLRADLQTCLPPGQYCDVFTGSREGGRCTGRTITVRQDGEASINIPANTDDGIVAIHAESKLG